MDPVIPIALLSILLGAVIALLFFKTYFIKRKSEINSIAKPEPQSDPKKPTKPAQSVTKKSHAKPHSHASDKVALKIMMVYVLLLVRLHLGFF